ncbi:MULTISPECIES: EcsC family protein [unclassified Cytobacillus]|uniref:EcsC family protein n=1 Tax=unclassified Cytobacillus TaxID=2675268 RepID=UPI00203D8073|nr:EcsC family protein [Cytobacillus sp. AMY 15.2]
MAIQKSIGGIINLINEGAQWSVRSDAIYKEFRQKGHEVTKGNNIFSLDLNDVDRVVGMLAGKYKTLAGTEGAAAGFVGIAGIPVDIVALLGLNLRAIGEYATYYEFDINIQHERLFALNILGLASSPSDASKQVAKSSID